MALAPADSQGKIRLSSIKMLDEALAKSRDQQVLLFKHSATCPISAHAHQEWLAVVAAQGATPPTIHTYLIVQEDRAVSDEAARRLGVQHESPQAILIRNGEAVWHASHLAITRAALEQALQS